MKDSMQTVLNRFENMLAVAIRLVAALAVLVLLALALIGTADVLTTRMLYRPIPGVLKMSEAGLVLVLFLGLAAATRNRRHVRVDFLTRHLGERARRLCVAIGHIFTTGFFALWTWQMGVMAATSWSIRETSTGLLPYPLYPIKSILFLGLLLATLESLRQLIRSVPESPHPGRHRLAG